MTSSDKVKVLYILGAARSGSTLLDRLLGQVNGFISTGELKWIWHLVSGEDQLCGCGIPFRICPFWTAVFRDAFGGIQNVDPRMQGLTLSLLRLWRLPQLLCPSFTQKYRGDLKYFSQARSALYRAIREASGCRVVVDSSKFNRDCFVLRRLREVDLHVIHLVRDSRAVAYSWLRKKKRPEIYLRTEFMDQFAVHVSARDWLFTNAISETLRLGLKRYVRVHYEDLVSDPCGTVSRICAAVGEPHPVLDFLTGHTAYLGTSHTVSGNPSRFQKGPVQIRPDMEWAENLSERQRAVVTNITWPLLLYYGYFRGDRTRAARSTASPVRG